MTQRPNIRRHLALATFGFVASTVAAMADARAIEDVKACWNTAALSAAALDITVVVAFDTDELGKPDPVSISLKSTDSVCAKEATRAFEVAREAILRCGVDGLTHADGTVISSESVEMTFDPAGKQ